MSTKSASQSHEPTAIKTVPARGDMYLYGHTQHQDLPHYVVKIVNQEVIDDLLRIYATGNGQFISEGKENESWERTL